MTIRNDEINFLDFSFNTQTGVLTILESGEYWFGREPKFYLAGEQVNFAA